METDCSFVGELSYSSGDSKVVLKNAIFKLHEAIDGQGEHT